MRHFNFQSTRFTGTQIFNLQYCSSRLSGSMAGCVLLTILVLAAVGTMSGQSVGLGTASPNGSALLHMESTDQGLLIPRMTESERDFISSPAHGLLVYQIDNTAGFYYNQGSPGSPDWVRIGSDMKGDFSDGGEPSGHDRSLGNHDLYDLSFITNDSVRLHINSDGKIGIGTDGPQEQLEITGSFRIPPTTDSSGVLKMGADNFIHGFGTYNTFLGLNAGNLTLTGTANSGIGESALNFLADGTANTAFGAFALQLLSTGSDNTAVGRSALLFNDGDNNTAVGSQALSSNQGDGNVAVGTQALQSSNANYNTAVGAFALSLNLNGAYNTALGHGANVGLTNLTNCTAIGANSTVAASNSLVLGGLDSMAVKVGIGTSAPGELLDIVEERPNDATAFRHENSAAASSDNFVRLIHRLNTDLQARTAFRIESSFADTDDATRKGQVTFSTADPGLVPVMTIYGHNVGIGTTTPAAAAELHITPIDGDAIVRIEADVDNTDNTKQPRLQFYQRGGTETAFMGFNNGNGKLRLINQTDDEDADMYFGTQGQVDMVIDADDNMPKIGMGTTAPDAKLHVVATSGTPLIVEDQANDATPVMVNLDGDLGVGTDDPSAKLHVVGEPGGLGATLLVKGSTTGNDHLFRFEDGTGVDRFVLQNDGDLYLNGTQIHTSDRRLKKNIETIPGALDKVMQLRGVNFDWRQDVDGPRSTNRTMGFIAQEVEAVIPHLVQDTDLGYKAVAYSNITALLVEAIKDQQREIAELRKIVDQLVGTAEVSK